MNILLVNDDGVHAPGIRELYHALKSNHNVIILAPITERSATGHTITLDNPLRLTKIEESIYALSGYPADCSLMGIAHLQNALNVKFDLVVSGINRGANLGQDIYYSGTVAAAREAAFRGIPAIAVSSCIDFYSDDKFQNYYSSASNFIKKIIQLDVSELISPRSILNINVPWCGEELIKGVKVTKLGFRHYSEDILERTDFRGRNYFWIGGAYQGFEHREFSDCQAVDEKFISVSHLKFDMNSSENPDREWDRIEDKLQTLVKY